MDAERSLSLSLSHSLTSQMRRCTKGAVHTPSSHRGCWVANSGSVHPLTQGMRPDNRQPYSRFAKLSCGAALPVFTAPCSSHRTPRMIVRYPASPRIASPHLSRACRVAILKTEGGRRRLPAARCPLDSSAHHLRGVDSWPDDVEYVPNLPVGTTYNIPICRRAACPLPRSRQQLDPSSARYQATVYDGMTRWLQVSRRGGSLDLAVVITTA